MLRYKVTVMNNDRAQLIVREAMFSHREDAQEFADEFADAGFLTKLVDTEQPQ